MDCKIIIKFLIRDCVFAKQLLVYGAGEVLPNTLSVIEPNMTYSLVVSVSERVRYGRLILVMDKGFCTDSAGNQFTRTDNSSFVIHFGEFDPNV